LVYSEIAGRSAGLRPSALFRWFGASAKIAHRGTRRGGFMYNDGTRES
jgi:hypothetical protein